MGQNQPSAKDKRRIIFTKDAKFSVKRFDKSAAKGDAGDVPEKIATLSGYAILWNVLSDDETGPKFRFLPNSASFPEQTMALFHHNAAAILGNTQNGTLRIMPDQIGVKVEIDLPDTTTGRDVEELVENRYVQGMSFYMAAPTFNVTKENGVDIINVSAFTCPEVTVTAIPRFPQTSIGLKEDDEPEEQPAEPTPPQKNSKDAQHRTAQALKLSKYKLAALAEFTAGE